MFNIAKFFLGAFTTLGGMFAGLFGRRTAVTVAVVTAIIAMTTALSVALKATLSSLAVYATPVVPQAFLDGLSPFYPDNLEVCLGAMFSARVAVWAYNFNKEILKTYLGGV